MSKLAGNPYAHILPTNVNHRLMLDSAFDNEKLDLVLMDL